MQTSFFFFFSLLCFFKCKPKNRMFVPNVGMAAGSGKENIHRSDTNCWAWTRPSMRKRSHNNLCWRRTCVWEVENSIRTERERGTKSISISQECNNYNLEQPTFTKGYKVTLYSDSLRATVLYAIYINSLRLRLSKGTVWIRPLYTRIRHFQETILSKIVGNRRQHFLSKPIRHFFSRNL